MVRPRIDRILFAATKADLLHHSSHDRLENVLRVLTGFGVGGNLPVHGDQRRHAVNSRRKGKTGELEFAEILRAHGFDARRAELLTSGSPNSF